MPSITKADAVKLFAKQAIHVNVVRSDKKGAPQRDPDTRRFITEDVPLAAEHIVGVNGREGEVGITTVDGQKYVANIPAIK